MNDATYEAEQARVQRLAARWLAVLGLADWDLNWNYEREGPEGDHDADGGYVFVFRLSNACTWEYEQASITAFLNATKDLPDSRLERSIAHEFMHLMVNELRDPDEDRKHEEHVVTRLAKAFLAARQAGNEEGEESERGDPAEWTPTPEQWATYHAEIRARAGLPPKAES